MARFAVVEQPPATLPLPPAVTMLREVAGRLQAQLRGTFIFFLPRRGAVRRRAGMPRTARAAFGGPRYLVLNCGNAAMLGHKCFSRTATTPLL
jgi:hypothetical protein